MARSNLCIFCGSPATSKEHLLPACLGGRIERKGILCRSCNNKGGHLDAVLEQRLRPLNMMLDVRSTRDLAPKLAPARAETAGVALMVDPAGNLITPTEVIETLQDGEWSARIVAANEREFQRAVAQLQAKHSQQLEVRRRTVHKRMLLEPVTVKLDFGGSDAFRAVARIVLNFLAHLEYDVGGPGELLDFKKWLFSSSAAEEQSWASFSSFPKAEPFSDSGFALYAAS